MTHEPFYPPSGGGSAEAMYLTQELVRRGHEVEVFCPFFPESEAVERRFNLRTRLFKGWPMGRYARLRNLKYLVYPLFLERMVRRAAAREGFEVVLAQHTIAAVAAGRLKRRLGCVVILNFLDCLTGFLETWPVYLAPRPWVRALVRFELSLPKRHGADGVLTVSEPLAERFAATGYPKDWIRPIYFGYDAAQFELGENAAAETGPGTSEPAAAGPVVVMHGSFDHHHLGRIALETIRTVVAERPDVRFRFVGRLTPALGAFCRRVRSGVPAAKVQCTGFVPYAEVVRHLRGAAVGMIPYEESNGTHCAFVAKAVEYLGSGLPVASTPIDGIRRYFADEPMIRFCEFDGLSLGRGVLDWLRQPAEPLDAWRRAARDRVRRELDWRVVCRKAVDFVEQRAAERATGKARREA